MAFNILSQQLTGYCLSPPNLFTAIFQALLHCLEHDKHSTNICWISENLKLILKGMKKIKPANSYFQIAL